MQSSPLNRPTLDDFDLEKYLRTSVGTRPEAFDWSDPGPQLDSESLFCLGYMLDLEANTIIDLRDLLSTSVAEDPTITSFLSFWVYEEFSHSRTLARLLETQGARIDDRHFTAIRRRKPGDHLAQKIARIASLVTRHIPAIHMTWGAINELTAIFAYESLVERARHPMLTKVVSRIVKDERRHFSFYYNQARIRLQPRAARRLTSFALKRFWRPVGCPLRGPADTRRIHDHLFAGESGRRNLAEIDATIARLPGLEWFDGTSRFGLSPTPTERRDADVAA
jgi:hypothetical protein